MIFLVIKCRKCGLMRKVIQGTPREIERVCGNCWDWQKFPPPPSNQPEYVDNTYEPRYADIA